ncbi:MAG: hypothetical protein WC852_06270 [Candidatus Nanoarchaeia archaeon]|jgi:hypothetical protein
MTDEPTRISPKLNSELEQLAEGVEKGRDFLEGVERDAKALQSTQTDVTQVALTVEEQKRAKDEEKKKEIIKVEQEFSPEILKVARTIDDIVNNQVFTTEVWLYCSEKIEVDNSTYSGSDYKAQVTVKDGSLEVSIKHTKTEDEGKWYNTEYNEEAVISINTEKDKINLFYAVRKKDCGSKKSDGIYRISRWARKSQKAFRFLAEDSVKNNNPFYINDFISMYQAIPEILAKAIAKMSEEQEAKKRQLEREEARLRGEGTGVVEDMISHAPKEDVHARTSKVYGGGIRALDTKLLEKKEYIEKEFTDKQIRDIGEEIGLYSTRKRRTK